MKKANHENPSADAEPLNYFNYFTEVEEEFVRRRGKPMFISPMDWALVESWKNAGIPLHIVLRAINESFDAYDGRKARFRKVNSIFYCEQTVETMFADYRLAQVGGAPQASQPASEKGAEPSSTEKVTPPSAFSKETLLGFIRSADNEFIAAERRAAEKAKVDVEDAIRRARKRLNEIAKEIEGAAQTSDEALEHDFDAIDRMLVKTILTSMSDAEMGEIRGDAEQQLKIYKKKIDEKIYNRTVENFVARRLREIHLIPRLSLFYI